MPIYRLSHSFTAGELSPLMHARLDFERYKNGCSKLLNMVCSTQGPATRRPGFKFIYDLTSLGLDINNPKIREIPFIFNEEQAYNMVFFMHTDGQARVVFAKDEGLVLGTGVAPDPVDVEQDQEYTGLATYNYAYNQASTIVSNTVWHVAEDSTKTELTEGAEYNFSAASGIASVEVIGGGLPTEGDLYCSLELQYPAIPSGEVVSITFPVGWDIDKFDWAQSADEMNFAQSAINPHLIKRYSDTFWELFSQSFKDQPLEWSDTGGWPEKVTFHQQRIVYACNKVKPQTVWTSKAGDFSDFGTTDDTSGVVTDDSAIVFTLDSGTQNKIQWISSGKALHIGTVGNEWTVTGNNRNALTPSNVLAKRETNNGSEAITPVVVGITTIFIERHGRSINEFVYDYTYDSYKTSDLSILSPHITEKYSFTDWSYQQTPDSIIWCIREDGALIGLTYQRQHKVVGWHQHDTEGEFKAITSIPGNNREDDVWCVVKRVIQGEDKYYLEKMADFSDSSDLSTINMLDSFRVYEGTPTDTITGIDSLEGEEVSILADGSVHPTRAVENGSINLNNKYSRVVVGLPYISEVWPLLGDIPSRDGTSFGKVQIIKNLYVDFYKSLGVYIGRYDTEDGEKEEEKAFRTPADNMGEAVPLYTGIVDYSFPEGYDNQSRYFIRQRQPLPLTVRGVTDVVEVLE